MAAYGCFGFDGSALEEGRSFVMDALRGGEVVDHLELDQVGFRVVAQAMKGTASHSGSIDLAKEAAMRAFTAVGDGDGWHGGFVRESAEAGGACVVLERVVDQGHKRMASTCTRNTEMLRQ